MTPRASMAGVSDADGSPPRVAIVDFGMGNLFSVRQACAAVGLAAAVTSSREEVRQADGVILPGVGAFGDAMAALTQLDLVSVLHELVAAGKPLMGICLGMQLLMQESQEFGRHRGLGILDGDVVRLAEPSDRSRGVKVPQVGWNRVHAPSGVSWAGTPLEPLREGTFLYFVHSFYVRPADAGAVLATTRYGGVEFCSSLQRENVFACQFHPERSGPQGLRVYRAWAAWLQGRVQSAPAMVDGDPGYAPSAGGHRDAR